MQSPVNFLSFITQGMIYKMKAVVITRKGDPSVLELHEVENPSPGPDDLLVRVRATSLNRADLLQREGFYPAPAGIRQDIPGLEFAGVVEWAGPQAESFLQGDRVMGLVAGEAHAELVATPAATVLRIPENLTFEEAAAIPEAFLTAHDALSLQLGLKAEERLLIHAVGSGVGTAAVQLARVIGAYTFGTSNSKAKLQKAERLGLNQGVAANSCHLSESIKQMTEGKGVDAILDLVGASNWDFNIGCLAPLGRMILVGLLGGSTVEADLGIILRKRLRIIGTVLRSRTLSEKSELTRSFQDERLPMFETGTLVPVIDKVFPLSQICEAHTYMQENRNFGKIVLTVSR